MKLVAATSVWARLTGLLVSSRCANGEVLLLAPCKSIHSFGMQCPIDIAFISSGAQVLAAERDLLPGNRRSHRLAALVLERRSNPNEEWFEVGDLVDIGALNRGKESVYENL